MLGPSLGVSLALRPHQVAIEGFLGFGHGKLAADPGTEGAITEQSIHQPMADFWEEELWIETQFRPGGMTALRCARHSS